MRFSDEFLSEVRDRNDIVDVISPYVDLRVRGSLATGLCPFHNEKTPSFTVYVNTQSYYCFGCGSGGDAITFIKNIENLDYTEAVTMLAERSGLALPADGYDDGVAKMKRRMYDAVCSECGAETKVPFKPITGKEIYCKECYAKRNA